MTRSRYRPRAMPKHFTAGMPDQVRTSVLDIVAPAGARMEYDVIFSPVYGDDDPSRDYMVGLDFSASGLRGEHFELHSRDMAAYRRRMARKRVAWNDLPSPARSHIEAYVRSAFPGVTQG